MNERSSSDAPAALGRFTASWVYGGFIAGLLLLVLTPVLLLGFALPFVLVVMQLPLYMIHQYEEHGADRFRLFVNRRVGGGRDVLSQGAVFVINIGGVWLLDAVSIWLAATVAGGFGLIATYGAVVNGVLHAVIGLASRRYNPGLVTAIVLLLPGGIVGTYVLSASGGAGVPYHVLGIAVSLALHVAIVGYVLRNRRRLQAA